MFDLLRFAAPVALATLGETVGQKSGVLNIGLEGMMLVAAYAGMLATRHFANPWVGIAAGIAASILLGLIQSYLVLRRQADQVVAGTAINLLALGITGASYRRTFGESGELLSIPTITNSGLIIFMLASVPALGWLLFRSNWGLAVRAAGETPEAATASGFSVVKLRFQASLVAAFYAGLAGAHLSIVNAASFQEELTKGRGFIAIAMVTFGRFNPLWAFVASLIVGGAEMLQYRLQAQGVQAPPQVFLALPYISALLVLVILGKGGRAPGALAMPYRKE